MSTDHPTPGEDRQYYLSDEQQHPPKDPTTEHISERQKKQEQSASPSPAERGLQEQVAHLPSKTFPGEPQPPVDEDDPAAQTQKIPTLAEKAPFVRPQNKNEDKRTLQPHSSPPLPETPAPQAERASYQQIAPQQEENRRRSISKLHDPALSSQPLPPAALPVSQMDPQTRMQDWHRQLPAIPETPHGLFPTGMGKRDRELTRMCKHRKIFLRRIARKHMRQARATSRQHSRRVWISLASTLLTLLVLAFTLSGAGSYAAYRFYDETQNEFSPQIINLRDFLPKDNLKMYDSRGVLLTELTGEGLHTTVPLKQIPNYVINATVSTEDKNFWTNSGVDITRIFQAAYDNLRHGQVVEGGSTITQQLIKNVVVGNQASLQRKLQEVVLTPIINNHYSKSDILEMYLNTIYYGQQAYGIDAAATMYFGLQDKPDRPASSQLDLAQAAMLAGIPNSPTDNNPWINPQAASARFDYVINRMVADGYISKAQALDAAREAHSPHFFKHPSFPDRAPHFTDFVTNQLEQTFHLTFKQLSRSDMSIYTTLDLDLQDKIQKIMQDQVTTLNSEGHQVSNAAEVLIDYHTGAIRSLLGSIDYNDKSIDGQFDVATQGYRQPGSSFKPYVYVTAFEQGASPAQAVGDTPLTINLPSGDPPSFSPTNYDNMYHGQMTLRCALQNSLNVPAVKVLQHVGIDNAMKTAKNMGISSYSGTPGYSLVLGGLGVHLLDHTSAFGTFANGGVHMPYYAIQKVVLPTTNKTYSTHQNAAGQHILSPQLAYMMTNVLSDNTSRLPEFFDCNPLQLYENSQTACYQGDRGVVRPAAAKTGTTNDFKDNWTLGYTTDYVMGVWTGNNNGLPMINVTGVQGAAPIWHDSMVLAEQGHPIRDFTNPGGLIQATATYSNGVHTTDWFLPGAVPTYTSPFSTPTVGSNDNGLPEVQPPPPPKRKDPQPPNKPRPYCPNSFSFTAPGAAPAW